jgi:ribosomal protein L7Ae-like RNA K-turn-binding protein
MAMKAGKVASGEFSTEKSVKGGQAQLVIVSEDASDNTKKMFSNMCAFYEVPRCICGTKEELGTAVGKAMRASLAVTDENFARAISKRLEQAGKQIDNNANSHLERV